MLDRQLIDHEFADIKDVIFLNVSSVVIPPKSVQDAYFGFMKKYIENCGNTVLRDAWKIVDFTRENIARLINSDVSEIAFVKNTTEGIGIIANGYPFKPDENVIVVDQEHPANLFAWINLQNKGNKIKVVETSDFDIDIKDIEGRIDQHTRAISISAVQYATGVYTDMEKLGRICKDNGLLFIVDGIQAIGRLNIDVRKMNIDYLACGGHKGLLGTLGAGFVFCSESLVKHMIPPYACYQSTKTELKPPTTATNFATLDWHQNARRFEAGNPNYAGIAAINEGVKLINKLGIESIEEYILELHDILCDRIKDLPLDLRTPLGREKRSGIICLGYPKQIESRMKEIFDKYRIYVTFRDSYIRISIDFYNTKKQILEVVKALYEAVEIL
jgi:selenocysteine lyase/cysteine desulfurase